MKTQPDKTLTNEQQAQEEEYVFPYHYLNLIDDSHDMRYQSLLETVKELLSPFEGQSILDAGCGDGRLCYSLSSENATVWGVDYSERAVRFARAFSPNAEFKTADLFDLNLGRKFDRIVLTEVLEHFIPDRIECILTNLHKHLEEEGRLIVTVPSTNARMAKKHYQHFTEETLGKTLAPHFEIESISGHLKAGIPKCMYKILELLGELLGPLSRKLKPLRAYYCLQRWYLKAHLEKAAPHRASRLIAVCRKK